MSLISKVTDSYLRKIASKDLAYGTLTKNVPSLFLHYTQDKKSLISILEKGFHLKRFGETARKYKSRLGDYDPAGIYAVEYDSYTYLDNTKPYLIFSLRGNPTALVSKVEENMKQLLSEEFGAVGKNLSKILLKNGIQVVNSLQEWIILDPKLIQIEKTNLEDLP